MISGLQASRDWNYQRGRGRTITGEKEHTWEEIAEDQRRKSKVRGKKRQEVFSGRSEKIGNKEASQDKEGVWDASKSLQLVQGAAGSIRGLRKVTRSCTVLISWLCPKIFGVMICKGPFHEDFRAKCLVNCPCGLG